MIRKFTHVSGIAPQLDGFVRHREARGLWCEGYASKLHLFDAHCARVDPSATAPAQAMVDSWFAKRDTETPESCYVRTLSARAFVAYARERGLTEAVAPDPRYPKNPVPIPHAFTDDELARFYHACDTIVPQQGSRAGKIRKITCPAFFRLLFSSGVRTTEARLPRRADVDLGHGVLDIQRSKGYDQHYVALHESMTEVLRAYDVAAERLQPGREWFFQSPCGGHYSARWVGDNFRRLWDEANPGSGDATAYMLRHNYATTNIMSWDCDPYEAHDRLLYLSKSMGHRDIRATLYYFSIVPGLADKMLERTQGSFNATVPEVWE